MLLLSSFSHFEDPPRPTPVGKAHLGPLGPQNLSGNLKELHRDVPEGEIRAGHHDHEHEGLMRGVTTPSVDRQVFQGWLFGVSEATNICGEEVFIHGLDEVLEEAWSIFRQPGVPNFFDLEPFRV